MKAIDIKNDEILLEIPFNKLEKAVYALEKLYKGQLPKKDRNNLFDQAFSVFMAFFSFSLNSFKFFIYLLARNFLWVLQKYLYLHSFFMIIPTDSC